MSCPDHIDLLAGGGSPNAPLAWPARVGLGVLDDDDCAVVIADALTDLSEAALRELCRAAGDERPLRLRLHESPVIAAAAPAAGGRAAGRLRRALELADHVLLQSRAAVVRLASAGVLGMEVDVRLGARALELPAAPAAGTGEILVCAAPGRGARAMDEGARLATCPGSFGRAVGEAAVVVLDSSLRRVDPGFVLAVAASGRTVIGDGTGLAGVDRPLHSGIVEVDDSMGARELFELARSCAAAASGSPVG